MDDKNSSFYEKVYEVVRLIPEGKVTSYGAIAAFLGRKGSARLVGYAMNNCHGREDVPAHRVVNRNGLLTGKHHFSPPSLMQQLLENEGIDIEDDQILNFKQVYWDPSEFLS
jgi:methylated-DNA-protein-cysteine methyltransferase-like protein